MVYSYTPTYYSSLHDSITSICKNILPFSFKRRLLPSNEQRLSKQQSDNLKWQQDSFHQILNLMGLQKEGILSETEVLAFRSHLLDTLIASPANQEQHVIIRDKLLFLQDLYYANCISVDEYHSSKRPLLQRLAVQGAEIEARDVIVAGTKENSEEEWSVIDLKDEKCLLNKESSSLKSKSKHGSAMKQIKGAASVLGLVSSHKHGKTREEKLGIHPNTPSSASTKKEIGISKQNPFWDGHLKKENETRSIFMTESIPQESIKESGGSDKVKKKPFRTLFKREQREGHGGGGDPADPDSEERASKSAKKQWGFDGFKKWKRSNWEDETAPLPLNERSDNEDFIVSCRLVESPMGEGPDTRQIKRKLHSDGSSSDFFIDKVLGDKIKDELSRIQSELSTTNPNLKFSNDQMDAISTKLPVDKADLKKFFPKSWCDQYGDVVLDVVKKEFKDHVGEMENIRNEVREKKQANSKQWTTFEDDEENCHPNLFANNNKQDRPFPPKQENFVPSKEDGVVYINKGTNPFCQQGYKSLHQQGYKGTNPFCQDYSETSVNMLRPESAFFQDQNPFWTQRLG